MPKKVDNRMKVFDIRSYTNWDIEEIGHYEVACTNQVNESFIFKISIDRQSFKSEFECIYKKDDQSVLLYRAEPNDHIQKFWRDLLDENWKRNNSYKETLRERVLKQFNFNWGEYK